MIRRAWRWVKGLPGRIIDAVLDVIEDDRLMTIIVAVLASLTLWWVSIHLALWLFRVMTGGE